MPQARAETTAATKPPRPGRFALTVALGYGLVGGVWIMLSDSVAEQLTFTPEQLIWVQSVKGIGFVLATGTILYFLVHRYAHRIAERDDALQRQRDRLATVNRVHDVLRSINASLLRVHNQDLLLEESCRAVVRAGGFPCAWIGLLGTQDRILRTAATATVADAPAIGLEIPASEIRATSPLARALLGGEFAHAAAGASDVIDQAGPPTDEFAESAVVPLHSGSSVIGVLTIYSARAGQFADAEEQSLLGEIADNIGLGIGYLRQRRALHHLSYHDELTGVGNRALIENRLVQAVNTVERSGYAVAVIVLDIDGFRTINDTGGRQLGDQALRTLAERLGDRLPAGDSVARLGNDEFALLLTDIHERDPVSRRVARIADTFPVHLTLDGQAFALTASMGVAVYPGDANDAHDLLARAELALHSRAEDTTGTVTWYSASLDRAARERHELERALQETTANRGFTLAWQPVIHLDSGRTTGAEVLLRWHHPALGQIPPGRFIPIAEQTGLITAIGHQVLEDACAQAAAWGDRAGNLRVAVNVALQQLRDPELIGQVRRLLGRYPERRWQLVLELTESQFMTDPEPVIAACRALKAMGCAIYIDDFGTGYSALNYLTHLPLDGLKIDRSFVVQAEHDRAVRAIVRAVIALARELGLDIIAEGVETEHQVELVRELGCPKIQGFYFGHPEPAGVFARHLGEAGDTGD